MGGRAHLCRVVVATYWEAAVASAVTASRSTTPTPPHTNFDPVDTSLACFVLFATRALRRRAPNADAPRCVPTTGRLLTQAMVLSFGRSRDVLFQTFPIANGVEGSPVGSWIRNCKYARPDSTSSNALSEGAGPGA